MVKAMNVTFVSTQDGARLTSRSQRYSEAPLSQSGGKLVANKVVPRQSPSTLAPKRILAWPRGDIMASVFWELITGTNISMGFGN